MANVVFRLSAKKINDKAEVLMRFYAGRDMDQRARTHVFVPVALWNPKKNRLDISRRFVTQDTLDASELQRRLDGLEKIVLERYMHDPNAMLPGWLQSVIDLESERSTKKRDALTLSDEIRAFADTHKSPGTRKHFRTIASTVDEFCRTRRGGKNVNLIEANASFVRQLQDYMLTVNTPNTVAGKLRHLRAVFNYAVKVGHLNASPFSARGAQVPSERYTTPTYLTLDERDAIYAFQDLSHALAVQRDIFIFQCHTGMRVSDMMAMRPENIDNGYLQYVPMKTVSESVETVRVPLSDVALEILARYHGTCGSMLPFISLQNYNDAIRTILKKAGIDRKVVVLEKVTGKPTMKPMYEIASSHMARRTFAANIYKQTSGNQRVTASMTGHSPSSRSFLRYTQVDDDMKREAIERTQ